MSGHKIIPGIPRNSAQWTKVQLENFGPNSGPCYEIRKYLFMRFWFFRFLLWSWTSFAFFLLIGWFSAGPIRVIALTFRTTTRVFPATHQASEKRRILTSLFLMIPIIFSDNKSWKSRKKYFCFRKKRYFYKNHPRCPRCHVITI